MLNKTDTESQLAAMANDPEIQKELWEIEEEFMVTETDGLETTWWLLSEGTFTLSIWIR
jgi:hypothetical protein